MKPPDPAGWAPRSHRNPRAGTYRWNRENNKGTHNPVDLTDSLYRLDAEEFLDRTAATFAEGKPGVHRLPSANYPRLLLHHLLQQGLRGAA